MIPDHGSYDHENEGSREDEEDYGDDHEAKQHSFRQDNRNIRKCLLGGTCALRRHIALLKHGRYTKEAVRERLECREIVRISRGFLSQIRQETTP